MNLLQHYLLKLSEECNEVGQMASKCMQFGLMEKHPDLNENNLQRLHMELDDLNAIVEILNYRFNFDYKPNKDRISKKKAKVQKYLDYSHKLGTVELNVPADQIPPDNVIELLTPKCDHDLHAWEKLSPEPNLIFRCLGCGEEV